MRPSSWRLAEYLLLGLSLTLIVWLSLENRALASRYAGLSERAAWLHPGAYVPLVSAASLSGDTVKLGTPASSERQLLLVFTTTCRFCLASLPAWQRLFALIDSANTAGQSRTHVFGVSLDSLSKAKQYASAHELRFPIVAFTSIRDQALYRAHSVPLILVIDDQSRVSYSRLGVLTQQAAIDSVFQAAIGEPRIASIRGAVTSQDK